MTQILELLKREANFSNDELKRVSHSIDHMSLDENHKISWLQFLEMFSNAAILRDNLHNKAIHRATTMRLNMAPVDSKDEFLRLEGIKYA